MTPRPLNRRRFIQAGAAILPFILEANASAAAGCRVQSLQGKISEDNQSGVITAEITSEAFANDASAHAAGEKFLKHLYDTLFEGMGPDQSEKDLRPGVDLYAIAGIDFDTQTGIAIGYWVTDRVLYKLAVTKTMTQGLPFGTNFDLKDIAKMAMGHSDLDLAADVSAITEAFLWKASTPVFLGC